MEKKRRPVIVYGNKKEGGEKNERDRCLYIRIIIIFQKINETQVIFEVAALTPLQ